MRDEEVVAHLVRRAADGEVGEALQQLRVRRRGLPVPLALARGALAPRLLVVCRRWFGVLDAGIVRGLVVLLIAVFIGGDLLTAIDMPPC